MTETEALDLDLEDFEFSDGNDSKNESNESNESKELSSLTFSTQQLMETQKQETEKYELLETDSDKSVEQLELIDFSEHKKEDLSFPVDNCQIGDTQELMNTQVIPQMVDFTDTEMVLGGIHGGF